MKQIAWAVALALAGLGAAPALAGAVSFVSVTGDDARSCATPATACRTFQRAHDATSPHGEIVALTPGDYRPVTITKSISVTGVEGAGVFGGSGETIHIVIAAGPSDIVYLTSLTLDGASTARSGVAPSPGILESAAVDVRKCLIGNMKVKGTGVSTIGGRALIEDSFLWSQGGLGLQGRSLVHRVVSAITATSGINSRGGATTISDSSASAGAAGIVLFDGSIFMNRSSITGNSNKGYAAIGGVGLFSAGDNLIRGNGTNVDGPITNIGLR
jgi:hypothetical protein